jgi:hypothetical protein
VGRRRDDAASGRDDERACADDDVEHAARAVDVIVHDTGDFVVVVDTRAAFVEQRGTRVVVVVGAGAFDLVGASAFDIVIRGADEPLRHCRAMEASRIERMFYALAVRAEKDARARRVLVAIVQAFFRAAAFEKKHGSGRLIDFARIGAKRFGRYRAPRLKDALGLDVRDMADMGRLQDWEDRAFGVTGHWTTKERTRATKCETACPFAEAAKGAPELCTDVVHALETETFRALNPTYRLVPLESLLSRGDRACEFRHEIDPDDQ